MDVNIKDEEVTTEQSVVKLLMRGQSCIVDGRQQEAEREGKLAVFLSRGSVFSPVSGWIHLKCLLARQSHVL